MQGFLKALLPGFTDGDMHTPAQKLAILISRERKGLSGSYVFFPPYMHTIITPNISVKKCRWWIWTSWGVGLHLIIMSCIKSSNNCLFSISQL